MPEVLEYAPYDQASDEHLTEREAVDRYASARKEDPTALVVLDELDCGHYRIRVKKTDAEKTAYLTRYLRRYYERLLKSFSVADASR